jgi:hypothetical protein
LAKKNKIIQSAEFKRDYVAALAVFIFTLIVVAELVLAFSIPWYLKQEDSMAAAVAKLQLIQSFDNARAMNNSLKLKSDAAKAEQKLIAWNLDNLAPYLRKESKNLTEKEVADIQEALNEMFKVMARLKDGKIFSQEYKLNTDKYINNLIPKAK